MFSEKLLCKVINSSVSDGAKVTFLMLVTTDIKQVSKLAFERGISPQEVRNHVAEISSNEELKDAWKKFAGKEGALTSFSEELTTKKEKPITKSLVGVIHTLTEIAHEKFGARPAITSQDYRSLKALLRLHGALSVVSAFKKFVSRQPSLKRVTIQNFIKEAYAKSV